MSSLVGSTDRAIKTVIAVLSLGILFTVAACAPAAAGKAAINPSPAAGTPTASFAEKGYRVLTLDEVKERMAANPKLKLVDVRSKAEYQTSHLSGAIAIPLEEVKDRAASELGRDEEIIFYCHNGPMGDQAARILGEMGYSNLANMQGGFNAWKAAGDPVVQ